MTDFVVEVAQSAVIAAVLGAPFAAYFLLMVK
jgi:hypothetical protein